MVRTIAAGLAAFALVSFGARAEGEEKAPEAGSGSGMATAAPKKHHGKKKHHKAHKMDAAAGSDMKKDMPAEKAPDAAPPAAEKAPETAPAGAGSDAK